MPAGTAESQSFLLHAAPAAGPLTATFSFASGYPSDTTSAIVGAKGAWSVKLPGRTKVGRGGDASVTFSLTVPAPAPGTYYVAVNRAKIGGTTTGDFGSFVLTLDEIH